MTHDMLTHPATPCHVSPHVSQGGVGEIWQHANGMAPGDVLSDLNFSSNIVYVDQRAGSALFGGSWLGNSSFASNLYWNESGEHARERLWLGCVFTPMALRSRRNPRAAIPVVARGDA